MPVQTFVVLPQQLRQPGSPTSASRNIPAGILRLKFIANILLADKLVGTYDVDGTSVINGKTMGLYMDFSQDGGVTFPPALQGSEGFDWTSYGPNGYPAGRDGIANPDPSFSFNPVQYIGLDFRLRAIIPQPLTVGLTLELTT